MKAKSERVMTVFLVSSVLLLALVLVAVGRPILKHQAVNDVNENFGAMRLRERLNAVERDLAAGLIDQEAANESIVEIKRAALTAESDDAAPMKSRPLRFATVAMLAAAPLAAGWIYISVGSPNLINIGPAGSMASREGADNAIAVADPASMAPEARQAMIEDMVAGLSERLRENPEDAEGWRMLARSQAVLGQLEESAESYRSLLSRVEGDIDDWRNFAAVLISKEGMREFPSNDEFVAVLDEIEARNTDDPFTLFYRGGAARENGNAMEAVRLWRRLLAQMPQDAPVRQTLEALIEELEATSVGVLR